MPTTQRSAGFVDPATNIHRASSCLVHRHLDLNSLNIAGIGSSMK